MAGSAGRGAAEGKAAKRGGAGWSGRSTDEPGRRGRSSWEMPDHAASWGLQKTRLEEASAGLGLQRSGPRTQEHKHPGESPLTKKADLFFF